MEMLHWHSDVYICTEGAGHTLAMRWSQVCQESLLLHALVEREL